MMRTSSPSLCFGSVGGHFVVGPWGIPARTPCPERQVSACSWCLRNKRNQRGVFWGGFVAKKIADSRYVKAWCKSRSEYNVLWKWRKLNDKVVLRVFDWLHKLWLMCDKKGLFYNNNIVIFIFLPTQIIAIIYQQKAIQMKGEIALFFSKFFYSFSKEGLN